MIYIFCYTNCDYPTVVLSAKSFDESPRYLLDSDLADAVLRNKLKCFSGSTCVCSCYE